MHLKLSILFFLSKKTPIANKYCIYIHIVAVVLQLIKDLYCFLRLPLGFVVVPEYSSSLSLSDVAYKL